MNIREATRADNAALCALEARTPLNIGDSPLFIKRDNFFETHDLQERTVVMLAEEGGEIAGVCAGALHSAPLAGQERLLLYIHHERIAPEHQRKGLGGELTRSISEYWKQRDAANIDSSYYFIAVENRQSRNFAERGGNKPWPRPACMCVLSADGAPAAGVPRQIGAGPTFDIVRLINATHLGEELFKPYEHVDFGGRLSRDFSYGWGDIFGRFQGDKLVAVAGLWRGTLADYGYEPGAEGEMVALLRSLLPLTERRGYHGLMCFPDPRSQLFAALKGVPHSTTELCFYVPRVEAPAEVPAIYIDPVYF